MKHCFCKMLLHLFLLLASSGQVGGQELLAPIPASLPESAGREYVAPPLIPATPEGPTELDTSWRQNQESTYSLEELLSLAATNNPTLRQARAAHFCGTGKSPPGRTLSESCPLL